MVSDLIKELIYEYIKMSLVVFFLIPVVMGFTRFLDYFVSDISLPKQCCVCITPLPSHRVSLETNKTFLVTATSFESPMP